MEISTCCAHFIKNNAVQLVYGSQKPSSVFVSLCTRIACLAKLLLLVIPFVMVLGVSLICERFCCKKSQLPDPTGMENLDQIKKITHNNKTNKKLVVKQPLVPIESAQIFSTGSPNRDVYCPRPQIEVLTAPKPRGWIDRKDPHIDNIGVLPIVQPRELSRKSKPQFVTAGSIVLRDKGLMGKIISSLGIDDLHAIMATNKLWKGYGIKKIKQDSSSLNQINLIIKHLDGNEYSEIIKELNAAKTPGVISPTKTITEIHFSTFEYTNSLILILKKIESMKLFKIAVEIANKQCRILLAAALWYKNTDKNTKKIFEINSVFNLLLSNKCIYKTLELAKIIENESQRGHAYNLISRKLFELGLIRNAVETLRKAECFIESDMNNSFIEKGYYAEAMDASLKFARDRYCVTTLDKIIDHSLGKKKYKKALDIVKSFQESGKFTDDCLISGAYNKIVDFLVKEKLFTEAREVADLMPDKHSPLA